MSKRWNFDIDSYLDPFLPAPRWHILPYPAAYWFGHRREQPQQHGNVRSILWAPIGIFCAISVIEALSRHIPAFESHHAPLIVGSFGAAAVLEFYAIETPLAQPRSAFFGQMLAVLVGVSVAKLFQLSDNFEDIRWAGGALACGLATSLMGLTKTIHPPAGATALLAVVDDRVLTLGWFLFPVMALGVALMLSIALIFNNIDRRFPVYWWTATDLRKTKDRKSDADGEKTATPRQREEDSGSEAHIDLEAGLQERGQSTSTTVGSVDEGARMEVLIKAGKVVVPDHVHLQPEEMAVLESISARL
jgi:hypothetical protein